MTPCEHLTRANSTASRPLMAHSLLVLRLSMGAVFLDLGVLEFFPEISPAQDLAVTTTPVLTFGLVPDQLARIGVACLEIAIGTCLLLGGRFLPAALLREKATSDSPQEPTFRGDSTRSTPEAPVVSTASIGHAHDEQPPPEHQEGHRSHPE